MSTTYTATFSNGETITRKSEKEYTHAWRAEAKRIKTGFAKDAKGAASAARAAHKFYGGDFSTCSYDSNDRKTDCAKRFAEYMKTAATEIVTL